MLKLSSKFNNQIPKYLIAAVLVIVPLFPKFPLFSIPGTYVAIRFEDLLILLLGILTLLKIAKNPSEFLKDDITKAFLLFFAVNLISLLSGIFLTKTVVPHIGILNYFRRLEYFVTFFAALTLFKKEELKTNLQFYVKVFVVVVIIAFLYGLGQRYLAFPIIITQNDQYSKGIALRWTPGSHINSTFAGHYDLAAFMVLIIPVFLSLMFLLKNNYEKLVLLVSSGAGMWLLINSLSRISQVSFFAAAMFSLFLLRKFKALFIVLIISFMLIMQSSSLQARFIRIFDVLINKLPKNTISFDLNLSVKAAGQTLPSLRTGTPPPTPTPVPVFEDRSTSIRLNVEWPRAIRAFKINPLLGTGYSSISLATDNDFLRMLGETGILGFGAFTIIFLKIASVFVKGVKHFSNMELIERGFVAGIIGGTVGTFIGATFIDLFEASKFAILIWFALGYAVSIVRKYTNDK